MKVFEKPKLKLSEEEIVFINEYINLPENKRKKTKLANAFEKKFQKKHSYKTLLLFYNLNKNDKTKIRKTKKQINRQNYYKNKLANCIKSKHRYNVKKKTAQSSILCKNSRLFQNSVNVKYFKNHSKLNIFKIIKRLTPQDKKNNIKRTIKQSIAIYKVVLSIKYNSVCL